MTIASAIGFPLLVLCTLLGIAAIIWVSTHGSRLAQENEGIRDRLDFIDSFGGIDATKERIRELEAERDNLDDQVTVLQKQMFVERSTRDAIRARTIEECAQWVDRYPSLTRIAKEIRELAQAPSGLADILALAQTDEAKVHQGD